MPPLCPRSHIDIFLRVFYVVHFRSTDAKSMMTHLLFTFLRLLLMIGGIEVNPGPPLFLKSFYSFQVTSGVGGKTSVHALYKNQSTGAVLEVSSSSQQTPAHLKVPFGALKSLSKVDMNTIRLKNERGEAVDLLFKNFSPQIIVGESQLKEILMKTREEPIDIFISILNKYIQKINRDINPKRVMNHENSLTKSPNNLSDRSDMSNNADVIPNSKNTEVNSDIESGKVPKANESSASAGEDKDENESIDERIQDIIYSAKYGKLSMEKLEIPNGVLIDTERVKVIKDSMKYADKTQTWLGEYYNLTSFCGTLTFFYPFNTF